ncbi:MAG: hypothetical protein ABFC78_08450 [Methanoregula sp.]|jgi:hypothetical protein
MQLNVKALALSSGIVIGGFTFVIAHVAVITGTGLAYVNLVGSFHLGWSQTWFGACIMTFWMFFYGLVGGAALAYIYNYFAQGEKTA